MISEVLCDTEDWSNDSEISTVFYSNNILQYYCFYFIS